jgi:small conductance mechanosensitive channel
VVRYLVSVVLSLIAGVLVLSELGVSIAPILGAAGVVGLAIGFGAQSLVKDYFTGFFLLLENQLTTGDVVEVGGKSGLVEDVTLRYVRLRDYDGNVHYVPNSLIIRRRRRRCRVARRHRCGARRDARGRAGAARRCGLRPADPRCA